MIHIGIDNGTLSGAICAISGPLILGKALLPVGKLKKDKVLDVKRLWDWIYHTVQPQHFDEMIIMVEKPGGAKNYKAAVSMTACFHSIRAMLDLKGVRWEYVTPQKWQANMLECKTGETKPAALKLAKEIWPNESWQATARRKKAHTGLIDAALIAEYNRRTHQ